jgi:glycosyltransferase involved in cell wall biosynthesis
MKVLLLTTHLNMGGVSVYTVNLARYLKERGIDVAIASGGGSLESILKKNGIVHITFDVKTKFEFGIKIWKALPSLERIIKDKGFDLIHAQTRVAQVLGCLVGLKMGIPLVTTCHGFFKYRRLGRRLFPCWGQKVIAISDSVRRHLLEDFHLAEDRVSLIYNGIETDRYSSEDIRVKDTGIMDPIGLAKDALLVGTMGRLSSVKGQKYLISAFKEALSQYPHLELLLVGEGAEKDSLEKQVQELGISDKVFFTSGEDAPIEKYLFLMDIFCLSSVSEGLGLALMEAMTAGRACIASDIEGPAELIVQEESGILVPPKDTAALSSAILRLAKNSELRGRLGKKAREKAVNNFSIEKSTAKTIEVYKEVMIKKP